MGPERISSERDKIVVTLIGFRCCGIRLNRAGQPQEMVSAWSKGSSPWSSEIENPNGFHVGTTEKFCADYYSGLFEDDGEVKDVILRVEIKPEDLMAPEMIERWEIPCGTEAIAKAGTISGWKFPDEGNWWSMRKVEPGLAFQQSPLQGKKKE